MWFIWLHASASNTDCATIVYFILIEVPTLSVYGLPFLYKCKRTRINVHAGISKNLRLKKRAEKLLANK